MKRQWKRLTIGILLVVAAGMGIYQWINRLPALPEAEIVSFFEQDALWPAAQSCYDSLRSALETHDSARAETLFKHNAFLFRQLFHRLMRKALFFEYRGQLARAAPLRETAEWLAAHFASAFRDSFYLAELAFYDRLSPRHQRQKLTLEMFYHRGQQLLTNDAKTAASNYRKSLRLSQHIGDRRREVDNLLKLKYINYKTGNYALALRLARETLRKARAFGYQYREVWARHALGSVLFVNGDYAEAAHHLKKGLDLAHRLQDELAISNILERLSIAARRMGDFQTAFASLTEAMELAQKNNNLYDILICNINFGLLYRGMGQYERAMQYYQKAHDLARQARSQENLALTLLDMGYLHRLLGQRKQAREKFFQALDIYIGLKDAYRIATVLKNIGDLHFDDQADSTALIYYRRALDELARSKLSGDRNKANRIEGEIRIGIGNCYQRRGQWQKAIAEFRHMREIFRQKGYKEGQIQATIRLADVYAHLDDEEEAMDWYDEAVELAEDVRDPMLLYNAYYARGRHFLAHQQLGEAEREFAAAIRTIEHTRKQLSTDPKMSYFATVQDVYDDMILLQLQLNRADRAFEFSERARARALFDLLNTADSEENAGTEIFAPGLDLPELQRQLAGQIQIVEYKLTRDRLLIFVLDDRHLNVQAVPIPRDTLETVINAYLLSLGALHPDRFRQQARRQPQRVFARSLSLGQRLYAWLVQPVLDRLTPGRTTYIIPDGALTHLPFAALVLPGSRARSPRFWLHEMVVAYAPSVAILARQWRQAAQRQPSNQTPRLLAIGNPTGDLKGAETEVRQIARLFAEAEVFTGSLATEARFRQALARRYDVLHFATHASANEENVWGSYLLLGAQPEGTSVYRSADAPPEDGGDNVLTVDEILQFDLSGVRLVTLSACETAGGRFYRGEGIFGLTQAFIRSGVSTILTSLWKVDDRYTQFLVVEFYRNWHHGATFAQALRLAQLALIEKMQKDAIVQYPFPFAWAGFVLVGTHN